MTYTHKQMLELHRCSVDPIYFIEKYALKFELYPHQRQLVNCLENDLPVIGGYDRQMGKTIVMRAYYLWKALFRNNQSLVIIASHNIMCEAIKGIHQMHDRLPKFMQLSVTRVATREFALVNGSRIVGQQMIESACRGLTSQHVWVDECQNYVHDLPRLLENIMPCLHASGGKLTCIGTGEQTFKLLKCFPAAVVLRAGWNQIPGRDVSYERAHMSEDVFQREYGIEF